MVVPYHFLLSGGIFIICAMEPRVPFESKELCLTLQMPRAANSGSPVWAFSDTEFITGKKRAAELFNTARMVVH
ncbi:hypothetical protein PU683_00335 [Kosakonia cowanii]|uniref:hypothetical protein n=1 Tax=Kosakonia cowanii TaxID=208223 RepID=UPI0023F65BE6|nr:hypothetical protein [Kosakonia cowanii]MDF7757976.1 hypothetical protein [Kosakonia cowanii]